MAEGNLTPVTALSLLLHVAQASLRRTVIMGRVLKHILLYAEHCQTLHVP